MKIYKLVFKQEALREWRKLGSTVQGQLAKKLEQRLIEPRVQSARLRDLPECYKIKARASGYRLVYQVQDERVVVLVLAVGRRERSEVYKAAASRTEQ